MEQIVDPRLDTASAGSMTAGKSATSWSAIIAGSFVAVSISLVLLILGSGLGLASVSPWSGEGASAKTLAVAVTIWLIVMQWLSSGIGGYVAGRLRARWIGTHTHEVFFRDTAHGFVTWAVATVVVAAIFGSSALSAVGLGARAVAGVASGMAAGATPVGNDYGVDRLFRTAAPGVHDAGIADLRAETGRIVANALQNGNLSEPDRRYMTELVAAHTGLSPAEAQKSVDDFFTAAGAAKLKLEAEADVARKNAAQASIFAALSMLVGAFIASVAAALGGRLRDEHI